MGKGITIPSATKRRCTSVQSRWRTSPAKPGSGHESIEPEEEGRVAEAFERGGWCGVQQYIGVLAGDGEEKFDDTVRVGSVGDAEFDRDAKDLVLESPVDEIAGDEFAIGDDHTLVVAVDDRGGPNVDPIDLSGGARDGDDVADADGTFEQKNDSADEVGDDLLQAEAETDAQGREDDADLGEVQVDGGECTQG